MLCVIGALSVVVASAAQGPDLTGVWQLNEESSARPNGPFGMEGFGGPASGMPMPPGGGDHGRGNADDREPSDQPNEWYCVPMGGGRTDERLRVRKSRQSRAPSPTGPRAQKKARSAVADARIADQGRWRQEALARMRALILEAHPEMVEERKWKKPSNGMVGVPVWSYNGIVCTGETYAKAVKLTFARGASLADPSGLFNASLDGNTRRAIDIHEGESVDARAFKALVRAAVALNGCEGGS